MTPFSLHSINHVPKKCLNKLITHLHFNNRCILKVRKKMGIKSLELSDDLTNISEIENFS